MKRRKLNKRGNNQENRKRDDEEIRNTQRNIEEELRKCREKKTR